MTPTCYWLWHLVKGLMAAVGLGPRHATYTCRYTFANHLYRASGTDPEIVQEQLGHASVKTTTIYARVTKGDKARAAEALAKAFRHSQHNSACVASWPLRRPASSGVSRGTVASS